MDELGYVIYAPTLSVAGLRNLASPIELREMLCGRMPSAVSQLTARPPPPERGAEVILVSEAISGNLSGN